MSVLRVVRPGPRTTVQDDGRSGLGHLGVPAAGAVDRPALHAANALLGNLPDAAGLEIVLGGAAFVAESPIAVAVRGATAAVSVDGTEVDATGRLMLAAGQELRIGRASAGVYVYVAVAGGVDAPVTLGSRSRDTLSGLGPAPLAAGDLVRGGPAVGENDGAAVPAGATVATTALHVLAGPHLAVTGAGLLEQLVTATWTVSPASDRTALRLGGPTLAPRVAGIPSEGLVPGAVQVPPDGQPILFLANHPVTGGYPVIAVVAHADIPRAAQRRPGNEVRFTTV